MTDSETPQDVYAGFWIRTWASIIDVALLCVIIVPLLWWIYGREYFTDSSLIAGPADFLISWVFPAIVAILFWIYKSATPGKMAASLRIVDARTGERPSNAQFIGRYFAYFISTIPLFLGFLWIAWDARKQGWHDKLAGTVVVRRKPPVLP